MLKSRLVSCALLVVALWLGGFSFVFAEQVTGFTSDITVNPDGSLLINETIKYDFEGAERRGIYRDISNNHAQPATAWYKDRYIDFELLSVRKNGEVEPYTTDDSYDGLSVRIGNPDVYISGVHVYEISYRVDGAISIFPEFEELYWNVLGDEWVVPVRNVRVEITADPSIFASSQYCYAGFTGSNSSCSEQGIVDDSTVFFSESLITPGEQLTIVKRLYLSQPPEILEKTETFWFYVTAFVGWFSLLGVWVYRWRTKYKVQGAEVAQYEPLPEFKPMYTGVLFDGRLDPRDISAGIVYLAEQGFISIKEITKKQLFIFDQIDYEITLKRPMEELETSFHKTILNIIFDNQKTSLLSFLSGTKTEPVVVGKMVLLSEIAKSQSNKRQTAQIVKQLESSIKEDLKSLGYWEDNKKITGFWIGLFIFFFVALFFSDILSAFLVFSESTVVFGVMTAILTLAFGAFAFSRRTEKGFEALHHLKGFKEFLSVTEKERYEFHNAPSKNAKQFMEYLPYAIAFGVEKEWAKVFEDIQITSPDWYQSSSNAAFNAVAFTEGLGAFSSSFSTSTGSSGSSGGGSAGGGSAGGGGGSW